MEKDYEVSKAVWDCIYLAIQNDNVNDLAKYTNLRAVNRVLHAYGEEGEEYRCQPLLFHAFLFKSKRCITWLLDNGADINVQGFATFTLLMDMCDRDGDYHAILRYGARVEIPKSSWKHMLYGLNYKTVARMFSLGLKLPPDQPEYIPSVCYKVEIFLSWRERACRRACYAFLLDARLPRDLVRWLLSTYVLPTKRESIWNFTNIKMPPGFELLD